MGAVRVALVPADWDLPGLRGLAGRPRRRATRQAYVSDVARLRRLDGAAARSTAPSGVERLHLRRYLASLGTRKLARATIARKAAALRCYFSWLVRQGRLGSGPGPLAAGAVRRRTPAPGALGRGGRRRCSTSPAETPLDRRDLAVLELLYAAGLRVSELCGLDRGDIDLRGRTVTVLGKGGKQRRVPIHDAAVAALRGLARATGGTTWRARPRPPS